MTGLTDTQRIDRAFDRIPAGYDRYVLGFVAGRMISDVRIGVGALEDAVDSALELAARAKLEREDPK